VKFIDTANLKIAAGKGGNGAVSFHTALFVPLGGPNGGDGGNGGDIIFVADAGKHSLLDLKLNKIFKAEDGQKGGIKNMHGANGDDLVISVPVGTILIDQKTGEVLADLTQHNVPVIIAHGGKGGKGNARFKNSRNKAPTIFEAGELGQSFTIRAELKVLADVGFVGLPNAGKSTLLRAISNSKPEVADYAFTTINPQLGVAKALNGETFVVADLPGLIAGASIGKGLGHEFLKHIERCRVICHVIDASGDFGTQDIIQNYETIRQELINYNFALQNLPEIIILNKMDLDEAQINLMDQRIIDYFQDKKTIQISGLKKENLNALLLLIDQTLKTSHIEPVWQQRNLADNETIKVYGFEEEQIDIQILNKGNGQWEVTGKSIFKIYQKFPLATSDNLLLFNEKLRSIGLYDLLRERGIKVGDIVKIFDYQLEWVD